MLSLNICRNALLAAALLVASLNSALATNVFKANNANNLNDPAAWTGGATPTSADVAVWDSTVAAANTVLLGANTNWSGIKILNPGGLVTVSAGNVLTLGAAGIDASLATFGLTLANSNILNAAQTWNVTNGLTLTVSGGVTNTAGSILTIAGGGTVVLSGAGSGASGVVNNGTLQMTSATGSGTGAITNNNGSTFRINTATTLANAFNFNGTVTVDLNNFANNQGIGSPGAISGSGNINFINQNVAVVRTFTLGGSSSSMANYSGTVSIGTNNGFFRLNDGGGSGNTGSSSMTLDLGTSTANFFTRNRGAAVNLGALFGGSGTKITQGSSSSGISTFTIGGKNTPCQFDGTISDGGGATAGVAITKTGTSTLTLTANNTYFGATTVSGGTLQIGNGGGTGSVGTGAIINNATLTYNRTSNFTVANAISGSGTTIQQGGGILSFSGANSSSGTLLVSTGTVAVAASGSITGPISIATNAIFDVTANPTFTFNQTVSGNGAIVGGATNIGGTISPGGSSAAGTLTYSNGLAETGNVNHQFELTAPADPNDLVSIVGDLTLANTNPIILTKLGGGTLANGVYLLFNYSGNFNGGLTNFSVSVSGVSATLTNPANQIAVIISPATRTATNLTWVGDSVGNNWDVSTSTNWANGANLFNFQAGDKVRFDNTGAANNTVTLSAASLLLPAAVVVDAANTYTLTGNGLISGSTGLTKTNTGTLVVQTTNSYTGPTVVGQGTLEINSIANGNSPSAIGASSSDPTNLVLNDATLRYTGSSAGTDRGATLSGSGGTVEVPSGTLTFSGSQLVGAGSLKKSGAGTLTLSVPNSYGGGTVISNGVLALGANNANYDGSSGSALGATNNAVTFAGGTLQLFGYAGSTTPNYSTCYNPLVVPAGQTGTLRLWSRGPGNSGNGSGLQSSLSGAGTLNLVINYVRDNVDGNWSAFTGIINVTPKNTTGDEFRINNSFGYSNAAIVLNDNVLMDRVSTANATIDIGELSGTSLAVIGQGNLTAAAPTWRVGWKNTSSTFAGTFAADVSLTKVGSGTFTLTSANTHTGTTTVSGGTLALSGSGSLANSTTIDVQSGAFLDLNGISPATLALGSSQTLKGSGTVTGDVDSTGGGNIAPGAAIGKLTVTGTATLGGNLTIEENRTNSVLTNDILAASSIVLGGTLTVTNLGPNLVAGDRFVLFSGPVSGSFSTVNLPGNLGSVTYTWTNNTAVDGSIQVLNVVSVNPNPTNITTSVSGNTLTLAWPADHTGWRLQSQTNSLNSGLGASWTDIPGTDASNTFNATIDPVNGTVFYRRVYP